MEFTTFGGSSGAYPGIRSVYKPIRPPVFCLLNFLSIKNFFQGALCTLCTRRFTLTFRSVSLPLICTNHSFDSFLARCTHCTHCGHPFCGPCSNYETPIPKVFWSENMQVYRVCSKFCLKSTILQDLGHIPIIY